MIGTLLEWKRVLKLGCDMEIRVTDISKLTRALYLNQVSNEMGLHHEMVLAMIYGAQTNQWDIRYNGFTSDFLQGVLTGIDFTIIGVAFEEYDVILSVRN